jgi:splicing factor 3A subunit 2
MILKVTNPIFSRDRRDRLAALAAETIDLAKDPYFMRNHLGTYECKLCLTLHNNEASYLAHTQVTKLLSHKISGHKYDFHIFILSFRLQGKKHQSNLARRAAKEAADAPVQPAPKREGVDIKKFVKIGRPGYRVTKQRDADNGQQSLLFEVGAGVWAEGHED